VTELQTLLYRVIDNTKKPITRRITERGRKNNFLARKCFLEARDILGNSFSVGKIAGCSSIVTINNLPLRVICQVLALI